MLATCLDMAFYARVRDKSVPLSGQECGALKFGFGKGEYNQDCAESYQGNRDPVDIPPVQVDGDQAGDDNATSHAS
jgi:hypothetical protein